MTERVLIADDSLSIREAAQAALQARGARVEVAADGAHALARLRDAAPELLIADVHMPGLDGYALCREAKTEVPGMRVLLLVGTFEPFDGAAATAARADGVVRKPFTAEELRRKVEELLGPAAAPPPGRGAAAAARPRSVEVAAEAPGPEPVADQAPPMELSDRDVDRIARRVLALGGDAVLERVARELLGEAAAERVGRAGGAARGVDGDPEDD